MSTIRTTRRLCCHLRWRELETETAPDSPHPCSDDGFFWCTHTLSHLGPDDRVADDASCRPGRVCFEEVCPPEEAKIAAEDRPVAGNAAG